MKKIILLFIFLFVINSVSMYAQLSSDNSKINKSWISDNPFKTDVFVENLGQFDSWAKTTQPIIYAVNNNEKIFFSSKGYTFAVDKIKAISEEERERTGGYESETYYVNLQWEGSNNASLEVSEKSQGYYTFGTKGYENIKAQGYKKLTYKNLYAGIDVEYIVPEKGGIKYSLIVHPGADVSKVKMKYTGDVDKIELSAEGNIIIKTPGGNIIDHAPQSFYKTTSETISSSFKLEENTVSFQLQAPQSKYQIIIIDPWTVTPSTLTTDRAAYDIHYDNSGNVYVSGGTTPFKLAKYSSSGTHLWTFTNPTNWAENTYSRFCIVPQSGTVFIGEGYNPSGPRVMKINSSGNIVITSSFFTGTTEIWKILYNCCTGNLIGFGGSSTSYNNLQIIADTNLLSSTPKNFNGYNTGAFCNDITAVDMDYDGNFYAIMSSSVGIPAINNRLQKSRLSTSYNPPLGFNVQTPSQFNEGNNYGIPGFLGGLITERANAVAVNSTYLFTYDGRTLIAWNKTNGAFLDSVEVDPIYTRGAYRTHEGIAVDECGHVWVGGNKKIHCYSYPETNGTSLTFTTDTSISITGGGDVYDICLGQMNKLYVCGLGFVTELKLTTAPCNPLQLSFTTTLDTCCVGNGTATVNVTGGNPPYSYIWSIGGQSTQTITGLTHGMYTVTVIDNGVCCNYKTQIDTVYIECYNDNIATVSSNSPVCEGQPLNLTCLPAGATYNWSGPNNFVSTQQNPIITSATIINTGIYYVTVTTIAGCTSPGHTIAIILKCNSVDQTELINKIKIYPNPVTNELIIEYDSNKNKLNFDIINSIGKIVYTGSLLEKTIVQTSKFAPDVYIVKLDNGKSFEFRKIIKE